MHTGKLKGLSDLLTYGRSKSCALIIGAQGVHGIRELYGRNDSDELLSMPANKLFLRLII